MTEAHIRDGKLHIHFGPSQKVLRAQAEARGANVVYADLIDHLLALHDAVQDWLDDATESNEAEMMETLEDARRLLAGDPRRRS